MIAVGTRDVIAGSPQELAELIPGAKVLEIPDRDHMLAVGDRVYKAGVLKFLQGAAMTRHIHPRTDMLTGADGNKLAADVFGTGGDVVALLHGGGQTRHAWRRTAEIMARSGMTAYAIDQRGHGNSEWVPSGAYAFSDFAADARAIANELAARHGKRAAVAGASLGGISALVGGRRCGEGRRAAAVSRACAGRHYAAGRYVGRRQGARASCASMPTRDLRRWRRRPTQSPPICRTGRGRVQMKV